MHHSVMSGGSLSFDSYKVVLLDFGLLLKLRNIDRKNAVLELGLDVLLSDILADIEAS